jgi:hypothetical protein
MSSQSYVSPIRIIVAQLNYCVSGRLTLFQRDSFFGWPFPKLKAGYWPIVMRRPSFSV